MDPRLRAIVWAQWRSLWNRYPRANVFAVAFTVLAGTVWYGSVAAGAVILGRLAAGAPPEQLTRFLPIGLMAAFLFWQIAPLVLAATGATLDVRKLLVYPIPHRQLFLIEVVLRVTVGMDVLIVVAAVFFALFFNPAVPVWGPLWLLPFVLFNLTLSAGIRDLLKRLFARKRFREVGVLVLVTLTALPQLVVNLGLPRGVTRFFQSLSQDIWPWTPVARLVSGHFSTLDAVLAAAWTLGAYLFGRWQFEAGLRFDEDAARATPASAAGPRRSSFVEKIFRLPSAIFPDPLGVLIEKEVRFLCRAPRFRLLFFMGFSFGLIVWMPAAFGKHGNIGFISENFLTFVSVYSLMLLGQVLFYNSFGFDRGAAQVYFLAPVRFKTVLLAKNTTAALFVLLEILAVIAACLALRLPVPVSRVPESFCVAVVLSIYLLAAGNLSSTYYPSGVDPAQSWKQQGGRLQAAAMLLIVYPLASIPISLAYLARWAFDSGAAFYLGLAIAGAIGAAVYWVATDVAIEASHARREQMLAALSQHDSPISAS